MMGTYIGLYTTRRLLEGSTGPVPSQSAVTTVSTEEVVAGVDDEVSVEVIVEVEEVSVDEVIVEVEDASVEEVIVEVVEDVEESDDCTVSTKDTELGTLKRMLIVNVKCQSHTWDFKDFCCWNCTSSL